MEETPWGNRMKRAEGESQEDIRKDRKDWGGMGSQKKHAKVKGRKVETRGKTQEVRG